LLVVEVSDTTLRFDRGTKATLYAQAGVRELWVADVNRRRLHVFTEPRDGVYQSETDIAPAVVPLPSLDVCVDLSNAI
jgi:Uma2 family endonuclease